jgi:hypothetical protein
LKGGQEQKIVGPAIMQRQDRKDHLVSFQTISMVRVYLIRRGGENWQTLGRCAHFPFSVVTGCEFCQSG